MILLPALDDLTARLTDPQAPPLGGLAMEGATNTTRGVAEIITYTARSEEAVPFDHRPLAIWTEGQWAEVWPQESKARSYHARAQWRRTEERFCRLIEGTRPSYAAITFEEGLPTPYELRRRLDSSAFTDYGVFTDFYVSASYLGADALSRVIDAYSGSSIESIADGVYISFRNLRGTEELTAQRRKASIVAARAIARARKPVMRQESPAI